MPQDIRRRYDMPLYVATIKDKIAAWKTVFEEEPYTYVSGDFYTTDGEIAFLRGDTRVTKIGRVYLTVKTNEGSFMIDPTRAVVCGSRQSLLLKNGVGF